MGPRKERRVLDRIEAALEGSAPVLSKRLDMFTALAAGDPMPRVEHLARRTAAKPLPTLIFFLGVAITVAMTAFGISAGRACVSPAFYPKTQQLLAATGRAHAKVPAAPSCMAHTPGRQDTAG